MPDNFPLEERIKKESSRKFHLMTGGLSARDADHLATLILQQYGVWVEVRDGSGKVVHVHEPSSAGGK